MNCYITTVNAIGGTAQTAQEMVTNIAINSLGFRQLGIYSYYWPDEPDGSLSARIDGIIASLHAGDIVVIQAPTWNGPSWTTQLINHIKTYGAHVVILIHDIRAIQTAETWGTLGDEINVYNQAEVVIAHSHQMIDFLNQHGLKVKHTVSLDLMDHPINFEFSHPAKFHKSISYAGSYDPNKCSFIRNWNYSDVKCRIYSKPQDWLDKQNVEFVSWKDNVELLYDLRNNGGFGMNWTDNDNWAKYSSINDSFKLSTYIAAGIPLVAQSSITQHELIAKKHLGIIADTLDEAVDKIAHTTEDEYNQMAQNVEHFAPLVRNGYFTKRALVQMMFDLFN